MAFLENAIYGIVNTAANIGTSVLDRAENYRYGEMAATRADQRTRKLYNDLYSPQALLEHYQEAGLSPSMMFGGTPGQGGMSGAQNRAAGNARTAYTPMSLLEAVQADLVRAETQKTEAETQNIEQDTAIKEIQTAIQNMQKEQYTTEFSLLNATWEVDGKETSMAEIARNSYNYDAFLERVRDGLKGTELAEMTTSEAGQKVLRAIYIAQNHFNRDIAVLSEEQVSANFQTQIVDAMQNTDFAKMNANTAIAYLKANIQTAELTETQKKAWNNLISKLGQKGSTTRDIVVVLGMILNQAATNWKMPNIVTHNHNQTNNTYEL